MRLELPVLLPLVSAFVYAIAALLLKRATERGIGPWRVNFVTNWIQCALFAPFWFVGGAPFAWDRFAHAAICGATFFSGQIFTFLALSRGDVSVATPVLGTKVIFVAFLVVIVLKRIKKWRRRYDEWGERNGLAPPREDRRPRGDDTERLPERRP